MIAFILFYFIFFSHMLFLKHRYHPHNLFSSPPINDHVQLIMGFVKFCEKVVGFIGIKLLIIVIN